MNSEKRHPFAWTSMIAIAMLLFAVIGIAMIGADNQYLTGGRYLLTAVIFATALYLLQRRKKAGVFFDTEFSTHFTLGFIFTVIGLTSPIGAAMVGMWALGIILFISGLTKTSSKDRLPHPR